MRAPRSQTTARPAAPAAATDVAPQGLGFLLGVAHRTLRRAWEAELADLELTAPQAALLRLIAAQPGQGVRQLARELGTDPMNSQRIAETLRAAGLCELRQDPGDARRRPLHPTDRGRRLAAMVARKAMSAEEALAEALGAERYTMLLTGLRALIGLDRGALDARDARPSTSAASGKTP
jgi:DNA-binding MarR family transcriptional regulator